MLQLPIDCEATYWSDFLNPEEAAALFSEIKDNYDITDRMKMMADGSTYEAETGTYMFADADLTPLDVIHEVWGGRSPWPESLARIRDRIAEVIGVRFPVARCVYYVDGSEGMAFHTDLPAYGPTDQIASISLGAEREFAFRSLADPSEVHSLELKSGSLLYMGEGCQDRYQHGLPHCEGCREPRINLTFRKFDRKP